MTFNALRNGAAHSDLYREYGARVYGRCRRILGEDMAAEDATQETFLRVHRHREAIPDPDGLLRWLYRIATNLCLNAIRHERVRRLVPTPPSAPNEPSPDELLANRDLVRRLISRCSPGVREAARLFYLLGLHQDEVACALRVSRRTVAKRLARFMRDSREFLGDSC